MEPSLLLPAFRVLIVEDNRVVRDLFAHATRQVRSESSTTERPMEVVEAANGMDAWELLKQRTFDLLVVDLYMPMLDGATLIKRIREDSAMADVKILAVSASFINGRERALAAGADDFVEKPLRLEEFSDALRALMRRRAIRR